MHTLKIRDGPRQRAVRWEDMDKRYTVFVSSTFNDLKEHRDAVIQAIMRAGHIPLGMEAFGAANASQWSVITKTIDASDYYVLLIARRYGSINEETGLGFTEMEYDYAIQKGVPCLVFQLEESAHWPGASYTDTDSKALKKLKNFRKKSSNNRMISFWSDRNTLPFQVITALSNAFIEDPRDGWTRSAESSGIKLTQELVRLSKENSDLRDALKEEKSREDFEKLITHLLSVKYEVEIEKDSEDNKKESDKVTLDSFQIFIFCADIILIGINRIGEVEHDLLGALAHTDMIPKGKLLRNDLRTLLRECFRLNLIKFIPGSQAFTSHTLEITELGKGLFAYINLRRNLKRES